MTLEPKLAFAIQKLAEIQRRVHNARQLVLKQPDDEARLMAASLLVAAEDERERVVCALLEKWEATEAEL